MPKPKKHRCTGHMIRLCPEIKDVVVEKKKEMEMIKVQVNFDQVINTIIIEWIELKRR